MESRRFERDQERSPEKRTKSLSADAYETRPISSRVAGNGNEIKHTEWTNADEKDDNREEERDRDEIESFDRTDAKSVENSSGKRKQRSEQQHRRLPVANHDRSSHGPQEQRTSGKNVGVQGSYDGIEAGSVNVEHRVTSRRTGQETVSHQVMERVSSNKDEGSTRNTPHGNAQPPMHPLVVTRIPSSKHQE